MFFRTFLILCCCSAVLMLSGCIGQQLPHRSEQMPPGGFEYQSHLEDRQAKAYFYFSRAIMLHNQGDLEGVVQALEDTIAMDERTPGLQLYMAEVLLQLNRDDEAIDYLEGVLALQPDSYQAHRLLGEVLFEQGDYRGAEREYEALVRLLPDDEDALLLLVQSMSRRGLIAESIEQLKEFIRQRTPTYRSYYALARLYRELDLKVSAEEAYRQVIDQQPSLLPVYLELGKLYENSGQADDVQRAIQLYREGLQHRPGDPGLRHRLAHMHLMSGDLINARSELEALAEDFPDDAEALRKLGLLYMELKEWPKAARSFERLLRLVEDRSPVRYYLGNVYENSAQPYEALREFLQIPTESELFPDARIHAAYLYRMLGEESQALSAMAPMLDDARLTIDQLLFTASLAEESGNTTRALQILEVGEGRFPGNTKIMYQRGALLEKAGMAGASREVMLRLLSVDPNHSEALNFIAYQNALSGERLDEALEFVQRAVELNESGHIYDTLGWVYYRMGKYQDALRALKRALAEIPDDSVIHEHLGEVYVALGDKSAAIAHFRKALQIDGTNTHLQEKLKNLQ